MDVPPPSPRELEEMLRAATLDNASLSRRALEVSGRDSMGSDWSPPDASPEGIRTASTPAQRPSPGSSSQGQGRRPRRQSVMLGTGAPTELERALEASLHVFSPMTPINRNTLRARLTAGLTADEGAAAAAGWCVRLPATGGQRERGATANSGAALGSPQGEASPHEVSPHEEMRAPGDALAASMRERERRLHTSTTELN